MYELVFDLTTNAGEFPGQQSTRTNFEGGVTSVDLCPFDMVASFVVAVFPIPLFLSSHHLSTPCRRSSFLLRCTRLTSQHPLHTQLFAIVPATMLHNITAQNRADSHGFYPHT